MLVFEDGIHFGECVSCYLDPSLYFILTFAVLCKKLTKLQFYGYNTHLYNNMSEATKQSQGLVSIAVMLQLGELSNPELRLLTSHLGHVKYKDESYRIKNISPRGLLPDTESYMTYEGSTTLPGCYEVVTWIIMNKPIYVTKQQLYALRQIMQGTNDMPKGTLGDNYRTVMHLNNRVVRTNIDSANKKAASSVLQAKDIIQMVIDEVEGTNQLVESCRIYLSSELFITELECLAYFNHFVTFPFLNCIQISSQGQLLELLPKLHNDLIKGKIDTLQNYIVSIHGMPTPTLSNNLSTKIIEMMCATAASAVKLQCGREYGFSEVKLRATDLSLLSEKDLEGLPTIIW
ncbi:Carbonic anhydrase-related protein 10 [Nymphon striatum]|nr:Carbonic anhydrase-related protein 10 [Nymphon striatum]